MVVENNLSTFPAPLRDQERIFIYGEYLKRKFYLDCTVQHKNDNYAKDDKLNIYIKKEFTSDSDLWEFIFQSFNFSQNEQNCFDAKNYPISIDEVKGAGNLYKAIYNLFNKEYDKFLYIFRNEPKIVCDIYSLKQFVCNDNDDKFEFGINKYIYERIIYNLLSHTHDAFEDINLYGLVLRFLDTKTPFKSNRLDFILHKKVVSKYYLYLFDLIINTNIAEIIDNNFIMNRLPRFFFLPQMDTQSDTYSNIIKYSFSPTSNESIITIRFPTDLDCDVKRIINDVSNNIFYQFYNYHESWRIDYSADEIRYLIGFIDSTNTHNDTSNFEQRIEGLYLWDKLYLHRKDTDSKNRLSDVIFSFGKKYKKITNLDRTFRRKYERYIDGTTKCIEAGQYLPLIQKKK